jgi:NAD(P)-dependent dehydrogenase (short-subunit alcohol dehydrogenase family)
MQFSATQWAVILGGSSGFGLACAKKLGACGMSLAVVHRDRKGAMAPIEKEFAAIRARGTDLLTLNVDALSSEGRATVLDALALRMATQGRVRLLLHSIAFGNLKLLAPVPAEPSPAARARTRLAAQLGIAEETLAVAIDAVAADCDALGEIAWSPRYDSDSLLEEEDFARTIHAMGTSLATWTQDLLVRRLFAADARVLGLTSEGNEVASRGYAAVAAAKVALESVVRSMALELAPYGIRSNLVQPGVTDTAALRLIPGNQRMKAAARRRNPFGRLTTAQDVAGVVSLLCTDEASWINGSIVRADGGEHISA